MQGSWLEQLKRNKNKLAISLVFLIIAIIAYSLAGDYVTDQGNTVIAHDLILDHVGPYNLSFIFVWLFILVIVVGLFYPLMFRPAKISYFLNIFSLFVIVRSGFIIFTHLRPPIDAIEPVFPSMLQFLNFTNDLFFSGHAGLPFLLFLLFYKENKKLAYFMLACSIILGITVLLMHVHYSIDVFSAYFITYGVYKIGNKIFK